MALRVPQQQIPHLQKLAELPDEKIQEFLDALSNAGPKFNYFDLATEVSRRVKLGRRFTEGVVHALAGLYLTREGQGVPLATFVDEQVGPALKAALAGPEIPIEESDARWAKLQKFLMVALSFDETLGTAAKAGYVLTEHERIFEDARIVTDVRPIFHPDISEHPNAALLIHMLRITQRDMFGNRKAQYFALDANDIRLLKGIIDRAIQKEKTLKEAMKSPEINILDPKATF